MEITEAQAKDLKLMQIELPLAVRSKAKNCADLQGITANQFAVNAIIAAIDNHDNPQKQKDDAK